MNEATGARRRATGVGAGACLVVLALGTAWSRTAAQTNPAAGRVVGDKPSAAQTSGSASAQDTAKPAKDVSGGKAVGDAATPPNQSGAAAQAGPTTESQEALTPSLALNPEQRKRSAWQLLEDSVKDDQRPQTRIQGLAALGMLRSPESERLIGNAMLDSDVDVRTAAALAAGQLRDPNLTTSLRNLLDDKEPQVAFTAAMTLAKMGDRSGEDILMAVVDGDRRTQAGVLRGTEHKISRDLHNPGKLAKLGAMQGAAMLLGPFGFGLTAIEFMHQSGGDSARAAAIEQIAQEKTAPIHRELLDALKDKDAAVRAAAARALVDYHDQETQKAVYTLLLDPKDPARLTVAASYLRLTGVPGPLPPGRARTAVRVRHPRKPL